MKKITVIIYALVVGCVVIGTVCGIVSCNPHPEVFTPGDILYTPRYATGFTIYATGEGGVSATPVPPETALETDRATPPNIERSSTRGEIAPAAVSLPLAPSSPASETSTPEPANHHAQKPAKSTLIRITDPWQGAEGFEQWVFVSRGNQPPPENFTGTVVHSPARRIVCMSSSYTAFLGELGVSDRIVGVSGARFISDSTLRARHLAGAIADVGYDSNLDFELIASLQPDLMLIYGIRGDGNGALTGKLREMGIPYVFVGEYLEPSPLGRAEWIVMLGEMVCESSLALDRFSQIEHAYNELKTTAEITAPNARPKVMFNAPYRDVWYVPGGDNYLARLVSDAGGEYIYAGIESRDSRPIDIEEAFVAMQSADVWLHPNHHTSLAHLLADTPRFASTPPVLSGRVYNNNARTTPDGGSDFWESAVVRPDLVLRDLVTILHHPENHPENHPNPLTETNPEIPAAVPPLYYYRRLR